MKIDLWGDDKPTLRFSLIAESTRTLLVATNTRGDPRTRGAILEITAEGELHLFEGLAENLGLSLDENKCIRCV